MATFVLWEVVGLLVPDGRRSQAESGRQYAANVITVAVPLSWLWFALCYADRDGWFTRRRLAVLSIDPAVVWIATLTITVGMDDGAPFVADDGVGVPEDDLDDLFDDGYTTAAEGTGLGLSIVRTIAAVHGWTTCAEHADSGGLRIVFDGVETD